MHNYIQGHIYTSIEDQSTQNCLAMVSYAIMKNMWGEEKNQTKIKIKYPNSFEIIS